MHTLGLCGNGKPAAPAVKMAVSVINYQVLLQCREAIPWAHIHRNSHQSQIKEDTGKHTELAREINLKAYSQEIQAVDLSWSKTLTRTRRGSWPDSLYTVA